MTATLPEAEWRTRPGLDALLEALGAHAGEARYVGGAVRDGLLGQPVKDVDIATVHSPRQVLARLKAAGIKAVPTGIDHGTVTAVLDGWPVEITTLRRDVSTDGRRATVAFSDDWREDAARRDFTINALYADPLTGEIRDYFSGLADLEARRIRFIGRAEDRIDEDHLRILRYFRFLARFGVPEEGGEAYRACVAKANSLMALSRERIADEITKLLATADPVPAVRMMIAGGILVPVVPEIGMEGVERLALLIAREETAGVEPSAVRRLAALLPPDAKVGEAVAARLKLSNKARRRIALALTPQPAIAPRELAFRIGTEGAVDRLLLDAEAPAGAISALEGWEPPMLPVGGGELIALGMTAGPEVARMLGMIREQWIAEGFPPRARAHEIAVQAVASFLRARQ